MTFLPMAPPKQPSQALYLAASSTPFATLLFCHGRLVITHVFSLGWTAYFSSWSLIWLRGEQKWHLDLLAFCRLQVSFCLKTPQNTLPKRAFQSPSPSSLITHYSVCTANTTANIYIYIQTASNCWLYVCWHDHPHGFGTLKLVRSAITISLPPAPPLFKSSGTTRQVILPPQ